MDIIDSSVIIYNFNFITSLGPGRYDYDLGWEIDVIILLTVKILSYEYHRHDDDSKLAQINSLPNL